MPQGTRRRTYTWWRSATTGCRSTRAASTRTTSKAPTANSSARYLRRRRGCVRRVRCGVGGLGDRVEPGRFRPDVERTQRTRICASRTGPARPSQIARPPTFAPASRNSTRWSRRCGRGIRPSAGFPDVDRCPPWNVTPSDWTASGTNGRGSSWAKYRHGRIDFAMRVRDRGRGRGVRLRRGAGARHRQPAGGRQPGQPSVERSGASDARAQCRRRRRSLRGPVRLRRPMGSGRGSAR